MVSRVTKGCFSSIGEKIIVLIFLFFRSVLTESKRARKAPSVTYHNFENLTYEESKLGQTDHAR